MRDVIDEIEKVWRDGGTAGVATVIRTSRSAPRAPGASMMVGPTGEVAGSVSGGCVEGAVYDMANQVIADHAPKLQTYGYSDEDAFAVGLTCGGVIDVYVEPISKATFQNFDSVVADIKAGRPVAVATIITHTDQTRVGRRLLVRPHCADGTTGSDALDAVIVEDTRECLNHGRNSLLQYDTQIHGEGVQAQIFIASFVPPPRMLVFGAIDFAAAVAQQASFLGYRVTVCDARPVFATQARFPSADEVVVDWPHRYLTAQVDTGNIDKRTDICILTHDPKFDVPLLEVALRLDEVGYIGAMGSRRTHSVRTARLREAGVSDRELDRLSSPIGLDLGGRTPEETAVSIVAEIIAHKRKGTGSSLSGLSGPIHHATVATEPNNAAGAERVGR